MNNLSSNILPCRESTTYEPSGVHGELLLPVGVDIEEAIWNTVRKESRKSGIKLGTQLTYRIEWQNDHELSVSFEVTE